MKRISLAATILSYIFLMTSCGNSEKSKSAGSELKLKSLNNNPDHDRIHLYFDLIKSGETDSSVIFDAKSLYDNDTVGFKLEVLTHIDAGITADGQPDEDLGFKEGSIKIIPDGAQSDNLVKSLGTLYNLPTEGKMDGTLVPLVFSSNNKNVDVRTNGTYGFKLFFHNPTGKEAEMFATIDTYLRSFDLSEKDSTQREAIISAFQGK